MHVILRALGGFLMMLRCGAPAQCKHCVRWASYLTVRMHTLLMSGRWYYYAREIMLLPRLETASEEIKPEPIAQNKTG